MKRDDNIPPSPQLSNPLVQHDYEVVLERLIDAGIDPSECGHGVTFTRGGIPHCPLARLAYATMGDQLWPGPFRAVQTIANRTLGVTFAQANHFALWWDEYGHVDFSNPTKVSEWIRSYKERRREQRVQLQSGA